MRNLNIQSLIIIIVHPVTMFQCLCAEALLQNLAVPWHGFEGKKATMVDGNKSSSHDIIPRGVSRFPLMGIFCCYTTGGAVCNFPIP